MNLRNVTGNVRNVASALAFALLSAGLAEAQQVVYYTAGRPVTQPVYVQPTMYVRPVTQPVYAQPALTYAQPVYAQPVYAQPVAAQPAAAAQPASDAAQVGDAYGFTGWLNSIRAQYGLSAVGYDANLEAWAQQNNAQQSARGMGHHVMGPARRQNSAMGGYANIGAMWMASPAHRAALLDPTISFIGLAGSGAYWTFNAY